MAVAYIAERNLALIDWQIWTEGDSHTARGIVSTPFTVKPFQVLLNGALAEPKPSHSVWECASAYPESDEPSTNPITGESIWLLH
jgi:hypothetical protein